MKFPFRKKLLYIFVSVIFFISFTTAIITRMYYYNMKKNELFSSAKNESFQIDNYIYSLFGHIKSDEKFLASSENVTKADSSITALFNMNSAVTSKKYSKNIPGLESAIYNEFERYGKTHLDTSYVYMGTIFGGYIQYPDGVVVNNYDPRKRPWYIQAMNNPDEITLSAPYPDYNKPDNILISACTTIKNNAGSILGVMGLDVSLDNISKIIKSIKVSDGSYIFLFSKDGTIIAAPNNKLNFKNIKILSTHGYHNNKSKENITYSIKDYTKLIHENSGGFETTINGEKVLINVYTSSNTGWKIASVIPKSILINEENKITYLIMLVTIFIISLAVVFITIVTKKITRPISELTNLMLMAENGNLDVQADIKTKDEFKNLGDSFNSMIKKLNLNYEELSKLYAQLSASEEKIRTQYEELQYNQVILRKAEERYMLALDGSNNSIWELDLETYVVFLSTKFYEMTGYSQSDKQKISSIFIDLVHPEDKLKVKKDFLDHINNGTYLYESEYRIKIKDNSYIWMYSRGKALRDLSGKAIKMAGSITDITERKKAEKKILYLANYDSLTNLPNRTNFRIKLEERLNEAIKNKTQGAIFFIDLDNFKNINDTMGHDYGDELLKHVSSELLKIICLDDFVCRLGGDEFLILHQCISEDDVVPFANQVLNIFNKVFEIDDKQMYITASIGIGFYPKDGSDVNSILKNADAAMYKAKNLGKNRYALYDEELYLKLERKTHIQTILRTAIENKELSVYYQPQYSCLTNEIYGFEALLRLNSRDLGFISPVEFIPIAEETGEIIEIGKWVFKEACKQSYEWFQKGLRFSSMSINISAVQINQPDFFDMIKETIEETKININIIELEITETLLMQSIDTNIKILEKLMKMGIKIALDDFGTGYSSMNYLRKIPLSTLKVDKSFIDNMCSHTKEETIIKNIIEMAHIMDLKVVAEGVEDEQKLITLRNIKCDFIQGYYFSKPLPPSEIEVLFTSK
jgi:diguanylate cyclase (GGDEF)-like protein/PAS domain S-box-containing protein